MFEAVLGGEGALPALVPLQADLIQGDQLLSSSLWVNVALAGLAALLFAYMGRNVRGDRARMIWVVTLFIPLVSISSYLGLLSGVTIGVLEMPAGHPLDEAVSQWGRYLTWAFSTPLILAALGWLADVDRADLLAVVAADIGMCLTGLAAALTTSSLLMRWVFYAVSCVFFAVVLYALVFKWPVSAEAAGTSEIFSTLRALTVVLWLGYPIVWAVGIEGLALVESAGLTSWGYSALDILAKYVFAFLLLRWVADNESVVESAGSGAGTAGATPADD
ncbi:bacteriorhodopsin [Salinirussus salinus]|jgi:halorhodopsin|uniref:bacteriorhodopsin n=1 Tax=Salinirussus salinus TaxID=1198300 RepID=UPI00135AA165|nr:bacteriorhodopsin [Salinirussus salinus]